MSLVGWPKDFADGGRQPLSLSVGTKDGRYRAVRPGQRLTVSRVFGRVDAIWIGSDGVVKRQPLAACEASCGALEAPTDAHHLLVVDQGSPFDLAEGAPVEFSISDLDDAGNHASDGATSTVAPD